MAQSNISSSEVPTDLRWDVESGSDFEIGAWEPDVFPRSRESDPSSAGGQSAAAGQRTAAAEETRPTFNFVRAGDVLKEWRAAERELSQTVPDSRDWQRLSVTLARLRSAYRRLFEEVQGRRQRF